MNNEKLDGNMDEIKIETYTAGVKVGDVLTLYVLDLEIKPITTTSPFGGDVYSMAKERVGDILKIDGAEVDSYLVEGVLPGEYKSVEEFQNELDEQVEQEHYHELMEEQRKQEWEEYTRANYDFEYGDWKY